MAAATSPDPIHASVSAITLPGSRSSPSYDCTCTRYRRVTMSRTSMKFSDHHSSTGGILTGGLTFAGRFASSIAYSRPNERSYSRQCRTVASTLPMYARSVRTSPGMNTLTTCFSTCSGKKYAPLIGCGFVRQ
jgi:hypothetical protein